MTITLVDSSPVLDTNSTFQVYLRLRPQHDTISTSDDRFITICKDDGSDAYSKVTVQPPTSQHRFRAIETFGFTEVFDESSEQLQVFEKTVLPLVESVLRDGRDALLATLGVTGSGKTHTILGNKENRGMTQLALDMLFRSLGDGLKDVATDDLLHYERSEAELLDQPQFKETLEAPLDHHHRLPVRPNKPSVESFVVPLPDDKNASYAIVLSMYEVYNDRIFDLLIPATSTCRGGLSFKNCRGAPDRKVVAKLRKIHVKTYLEALEVIEAGQLNRRNGETGSNDKSSRSHCFVQMEVKNLTKGRHGIKREDQSTLTIVDLAGSERARSAKTGGDRLAEGGHINKSLMCLGQCLQLSTLNAQDPNARPAMIPYRQSKLTELLFSNSYTSTSTPQLSTIIITADPTGDFNATSQILRYSALARTMTIPRAPLVANTNVRMVSTSSNGSTALSAVSALEEPRISTSVTIDESTRDLIASLRSRLSAAESRATEAEERWQEAEERCLETESLVREEVAEEMEQRIKLLERTMLIKLDEEQEFHEEHMDKKLDLLKKTINAQDARGEYEDEDYVRSLEEENEALRQETLRLKRDQGARSPTKKGGAKVRA